MTMTMTMRSVRRTAWTAAATLALTTLVLNTAASSSAADRGFVQCSVPSGPHPTLQSAIADQGCDSALLGSGDYLGPFVLDRTFTVQGPTDFSARLLGPVHVDAFAADDVFLNFVQLELDPLAGLIFKDGFEAGDTEAWNASVP